MDSYLYKNKRYRIRQKDYRGANGTVYTKYTVSLPIGYDIAKQKNCYHEYSANSIDELTRKIEYDTGEGYINSILIPSDITVKELSEKWLNIVWNSLSKSSRSAYRAVLNCRIYPYIGDKKAKDAFSFDSIQNLVNNLYRNGYKDGSLRNTKIVLSDIINFGIQNRILFSNPFEYIIMPKTQKKTFNILDKVKMQQLLKIAHRYKYGNFFAICMLGAMRTAECRGLSIHDVNIDQCSVFIHQQYRKGTLIARTKNGSSRKIVLPDVAKSFMLAEQKKRNLAQVTAVDKWDNQYGLFFTESDGRPIAADKLYDEFQIMMRELDVDNIRIHDLRHSMATAIVNQSKDIFEAQRYLGHKHINTTKVYLHSTTETRLRLTEAMNKYFSVS